jgi:transcription antitermination factor NusG
MKRWYVVQSNPNKEYLAAAELRAKNFKIFLPVYLQTHKKGSKIIKQQLPLFPSYLFIEFDLEENDRWKYAARTRGVLNIVTFSENSITPVPEGCVEDLISRLDEHGNVPLEAAISQVIEFTPEMKLRIVGENYKDLIATYCKHSEKRVTVLLTLLNRKIKVVLPIDSIAPL